MSRGGGHIGYYIRPGKHSMGKEDWQTFVAFADKHLSMGAARDHL